MLIKITVQGGIVQEVETSEPAIVQIHDLDAMAQGHPTISTFETVAQAVVLESEDNPAKDALLNHEVMADPLHALFEDE